MQAMSTRGAPHHVAIIMDGNRRWARSKRLPAIEGHRRGIVALREVTRAASDAGVKFLTVYGFSTENWQRDAREISLLFELCVYFAKTEVEELNRNNVRVHILGGWEELPPGSREALRSLQERTAQNTGLQLNLAVNYSSRFELERAVKAIARDVAEGRLAVDQIDDARIASYFFTADLPDPELVIRPGGEHRLSNFLLYQAAYSELLMSDVYWPDFGRDEFLRALADYAGRRRRFGT
jgi:undecaprenyl diphosphate synthase